MKKDTAIIVENVNKYFDRFHALKNVTLTVQKGDITGFIGENGAGKTTLMRMICGLIKPSNGTIEIFEKDIRFTSSNHRQDNQQLCYIIGFCSIVHIGIVSRISACFPKSRHKFTYLPISDSNFDFSVYLQSVGIVPVCCVPVFQDIVDYFHNPGRAIHSKALFDNGGWIGKNNWIFAGNN